MKRIITYIFIGLVIAVSIVLATQRTQIKEYASAYLKKQIETYTGCNVEVANIQFHFPLHLHVDTMKILTDDQPVAFIENLEISLTPWKLWRSGLVIDSLQMEKAEILGIFPTPSHSPQSENLPWTSIPAYAEIRSLKIQNLKIDSKLLSLLPQDVQWLPRTLFVSGQGSLNPHTQEFFIDLTIADANHLSGQTHLVADISQKNDQILTQIRLSEIDNGILTKQYNLPAGYTFHSFVQASGEFEAWKKLWTNSETSSSGIIGEFQINYSAASQSSVNSILGPEGFLEGAFTSTNNHSINIGNFIANIGSTEFGGTLSVNKMNDVYTGNLSASCEYAQQIAAINCAFQWDDLLRLSNIRSSLGETELTGNIQWDMQNSIVLGDLSGSTNLSLLSKHFKKDVSGPLSFQVHLDHENRIQIAHLTAKSPHIHLMDYTADQTDLYATIINPLENPKTSIKLSCQHASFNQWKIDNLLLETHMDKDQTEYPFTLAMSHETGSRLESQGNWFGSPEEIFLTIHSLSANYEKYSLNLEDAIALYWNAEQLDISPIHLNMEEGSIQLTCNFLKDQILMLMQAQDIPLDILRLLNPSFSLDGTASMEAELCQTDHHTTGNLKLDFQNIQLANHTLGMIFPLQATVHTNLKSDELSFTGSITGIGLEEPMAISAVIPASISLLPFSFDIAFDKPIQSHIALEGPIESVLELLMPATGPSITGHASTLVDVAGTLSHPKLQGRIDLEDGSFDIPDIGLDFREINAQIDFNGQQAILTSLNGTDGKSGSVSGQGKVDLDPDKLFPFDISFKIDQSLLKPSDYAEAIASGDLHLTGDFKSATLHGKIISDALKITIPEEIPELAQSVEVTYINQPEDLPRPTTYSQRQSAWPLNLDLNIEIPRRGLIISGRDWSSEWKGDISVTGTTDTPLLRGAVQVVNGEYRFNGKEFEIKEGTITFAGDPEKKTALYVVARKDLNTISADIVLKGPLRNPAITFQSSPPMPQREILSWILFNSGTSDITPFQGNQLNDSITNLNTRNGKPDVLSQIKDRIGIDKLDISRGENGSSNEVSVQVGKYISKGILVSVNKSVTAEANRVAVEASIIDNVKVEAQMGDDSKGELRLKWKKDY